jgi:hypothetical protein
MHKHKQFGFGMIGTLIVIVAVAAVGLIGFRILQSKSSEPSTATEQHQQKQAPAHDDLALKNLGMASLDGVHVTSGALRDYSSQGLKGFYAFGDKLANTGKLNPNFEFSSVKPGTKVVAAIDGVVVFIKEQAGSGDREVFLQTFDGSVWMIGYDHLTAVTVRKGDTVKAGDVLGEPAKQGNGLLRFELQINKKQADGSELSYCPSALLDNSVKADTQAALTTMMQQWNQLNKTDLYNIAAQNPVGCLGETVKP